ncbi:MAG: class I adenylate-forming enzyme family protein [Victivallales bacterium]|jgi:long-chain acyl-CoA synthetase
MPADINIYTAIKSEVGSYDGMAVIEDERIKSYQTLFADAERTAETLLASGIVPASRVAVNGDNSYEYVVVCLALLSIDAVIVPISINATAPEAENIIERIAVNFLISDRPDSRGSPLFQGDLSRPYRIVSISREIIQLALPDGRRPAFIRFSSGTTGSSKGVVLSHHAVLERTASCTGLGISRGEHILWVLDMAYHFIVTILLFIRKSATIVICGRPVETKMISTIRKFPVRLIYATPYHYRLMISSSELRKEEMTGVRLMISTAMKLTAAEAAAFTEKFGVSLAQAYGIIEIGLPCLNSSGMSEKTDSAGKIQPGYDVRISNPDPEGTGEILIRGPGMFDAYFSPFLLREQVCPDGWFNTGDLGYVDRDGYLFIVGRSKNVINFMGMKIFPDEVEEVICSHPEIAEARVYGRQNPVYGEIPVAEIVLKKPDQVSADLTRQLRRYCFARLSEYKVPKEFSTVTAIPKTVSGKTIRS